MSSTSHTLCEICKLANFKYICPKCNIPFCSVNCYKNPVHNRCSEEFYRNCVKEEMALRSCPNSIADIPGLSDDIIRMYKILKRFESQESVESSTSSIDIEDFDFDEFQAKLKNRVELDSDDSTEEGKQNLADRLKGVNFDDPDEIWERLNSKEKQEFEALIQKGNIAQILPAFKPWWIIQEKKKLIEDICNDDDVLKKNIEVKFCHPEIIGNIEPLDKLLKKQPSLCLRNNLVNVLAAYTCTVRFFNGEHHTTPLEATNYLVTLSATLKNNANFDDEDEAIKSIIHEGQTENLGLDSEECKIIQDDIKKILEGRYQGKIEPIYILAALSDIHRLFENARNFKKNQKITDPSVFSKKFMETQLVNCEKLTRVKLTQLIKKIEFLLSYVDSRR